MTSKRKKKKNYSIEPQNVYEDIYKIKLPLPGMQPGPVNVYLIKSDPITLIDTGIYQHFGMLKKALGKLDVQLSDIKQLIITHGHIDHGGAAAMIKAESSNSLSVKIHHEDSAAIENKFNLKAGILYRFSRLNGVPIRYCLFSIFFYIIFSMMQKSCKIDEKLEDNQIIRIGKHKARVIATPGHSKGSICLHLEDEGILFSGDHVIEHITPNAFAMLERNSVLPVRYSQKEYYESITKIEKNNYNMVLSGHGKDIPDLKLITNMYREKFSDRQKKIVEILKGNYLTTYEIAQRLFPDIFEKNFLRELFLCISEVYTHLEILQLEKKACFKRKSGKIYFSIVNDLD